MRCELPECARCCFCFPLRYGLLVWAYVKLGIILFLLVNSMGIIISDIERNVRLINFNLSLFTILVIFAAFFFVDLIFHIILIIGAHTKEYKKVQLFYKEAIFGLGLYVFGFVYSFIYLFMTLYMFAIFFGMIVWCFFFWLILSQAYLIILVRSEMLKLKRNTNTNYEFTNHATDEERAKVERINVIDEENIAA